ncbi:MAG: fibronectin type III domain-containing protein [Hyphomicrobiales bacterium]
MLTQPSPIDPGTTLRTRAPLGWILAALVLAGTGLGGLTAPRAASAQTSSDSTVVLLWTAPGDDGNVGRASSYDIRYRTVNITGTDTLTWWNGATQVTGEPSPGVAGTTDSMRVAGLTPLTTYYFMIRAADEVPNWSGFSNLASKTTGGDTTPPSAVNDLAVTGTSGNSISVRWTAPGDDGNVGTATTYDIRYSTSSITNGNWSSATQATGEPAPLAAGTQQTFTLTGLNGSQTYYIAIRTIDDRGNVSTLSNVVNGTTGDTVAPAPIRDLSYFVAPGADLGPAGTPVVAERHDA